MDSMAPYWVKPLFGNPSTEDLLSSTVSQSYTVSDRCSDGRILANQIDFNIIVVVQKIKGMVELLDVFVSDHTGRHITVEGRNRCFAQRGTGHFSQGCADLGFGADPIGIFVSNNQGIPTRTFPIRRYVKQIARYRRYIIIYRRDIATHGNRFIAVDRSDNNTLGRPTD